MRGLIAGLAVGAALGAAVPTLAGERDQTHTLIYRAASQAVLQATSANEKLGNPNLGQAGTIAGQLQTIHDEVGSLQFQVTTLEREMKDGFYKVCIVARSNPYYTGC